MGAAKLVVVAGLLYDTTSVLERFVGGPVLGYAAVAVAMLLVVIGCFVGQWI